MNPNPHESPGSPQKTGAPIVLACPACGHLLRLSHQHLGIKGNCVSCKSEIMGAEVSPGKFEAVYANPADNKPVVLEAEIVDPKPAAPEPAPAPEPTPKPAPEPEATKSTFGGFGVADVEGIDEVEPVGGSFFGAKGAPAPKEEKPTPPPNPDNEAPSFFTQGAAIESGKAKETPTPAEDEAAQKSWGFSEAVSRKDQAQPDTESAQPAKPAASSPFPAAGQSQPQTNRFAIKEKDHSAPPVESPKPQPEPTPATEPAPKLAAAAAQEQAPASAPSEEPANPFTFSKEAKPPQPEAPKEAEMERPPFAPISSSVGTAGKTESPFKASPNQAASPFSKPAEPKPEPVAQTSFPSEAPPSFLPETPAAAEATPTPPQPEPAPEPKPEPKLEQPAPVKETFAAPAAAQGDPNSPFADNQFKTAAPPREEAFPTEEPAVEMKSPFEEEEPEDSADILRNFLTEGPTASATADAFATDSSQPEAEVNSQPAPDPINFSNIKLKSTNPRKFQLGTTGVIALLLVFSVIGGVATYLFTPEAKKQEFKTQLAEWLEPGAVVIEKLPFGLGENLTPPPQKLSTPKAMEINPSAVALPIGPDIKSTASPALPAND